MIKRRTFYEPRLWRALAVAAALLLATAAQTAAQQPPDAAQTLYRWTSSTPADQLAADTTVVPSGMGALFVPAMTGSDEPEALVFQGEKRVGGGPNGQRIVLAPGSYTVRVGSAPLNQMVTIPVNVTAGNTTLVPVTWGALVVEVVDENNIPHRGSYELIQVSDCDSWTRPVLAPTRSSASASGPCSWGQASIASCARAPTIGRAPISPPWWCRRARSVHYKLVLDPDDGTLLGAGVVPPEELGILTDPSGWSRMYLLSVGVPFASSSNVVGASNQTSVGMNMTFDYYLRYHRNNNYMSSILEVEQGFESIDPQDFEPLPLQKTSD